MCVNTEVSITSYRNYIFQIALGPRYVKKLQFFHVTNYNNVFSKAAKVIVIWC